MGMKGDFMTKKELDAMVAAEEKRLGVGSKEFIQRHNEIMQMVEEASQKGVNQMVCADVMKMLTVMCNSRMTPRQIAEKAGVSTSAVYRVRKGYLVKMEIMGKVCAALGVKCEDVLDYERMERYRKERKENATNCE